MYAGKAWIWLKRLRENSAIDAQHLVHLEVRLESRLRGWTAGRVLREWADHVGVAIARLGRRLERRGARNRGLRRSRIAHNLL